MSVAFGASQPSVAEGAPSSTDSARDEAASMLPADASVGESASGPSSTSETSARSASAPPSKPAAETPVLDGAARAPSSTFVPDAGVRDASVTLADARAETPVPAPSSSSTPVAGACAIPADAEPVDSSRPTTVVGAGDAASCTSRAFVDAVAKGGVITFDCGPDPVTITLEETAKVFNRVDGVDTTRVVIDGGGKITLSGGGRVRMLYQNTCDRAQVWTTERCDDQEFPQLTVQNLTFVDGNAKNESEGGGAIYARGGRLKIVNSRFYNNVCADVGPDVGGGAVRVFQQYRGLPVHVVNSTFGGDASRANVCSNGGALSTIGASFNVLNSTLSHNRAVGHGANPAQAGTPGGGSGGAIYADGNTLSLTLCGASLANNQANEGGGAIFFVSNDRSGTLSIRSSDLESNPSGKFETYPGIFVLASGAPTFEDTTLR